MKTIIIADSLTNDFMGLDRRFHEVKVHVGAKEAERLLGTDQDYGYGPLPSFLRSAFQARSNGQSIETLFVRDSHQTDDPIQQPELLRYGPHNIQGTPGIEFVDAVDELVDVQRVIETSTLSIPIPVIHKHMQSILGTDIFSLTDRERQSVQFILTGVYSDIRVLGTANMLRNQYGFPNVYVCPHLTGSSDPHAHLEALQAGFPNILVHVIPSLQQIFSIANLPFQDIRNIERYESCKIEPKDASDNLQQDQRAILNQMFIGYSHLRVKSLGGGYSGSLLLLGTGKKPDGALAVPVIVKIDRYQQILKELHGYHLIKDLLGKHAPAFSAPVTYGEWTGIRMDFAGMQGSPRTLQELYETAGRSDEYAVFSKALDASLGMLSERLYNNTLYRKKSYIYREMGLHTALQAQWLNENIENITGVDPDAASTLQLNNDVVVSNPVNNFVSITKHIDRVDTDHCLSHGDLNLQNILVDQASNIWIIDWPFTEKQALETDFAKLENDIKFVLGKNILEEDLSSLQRLEKHLLTNIQLTSRDRLPSSLEFVNRDLRLRRMYDAVQLLRQQYLAIRTHGNDALYRIALLKYSVHTLSFDQRKGRGECLLPQLKYALLSTALLVELLHEDPLHQQARKDRPDDYPAANPIPIDKVSWDVEYHEYQPVAVGEHCDQPKTRKNPSGRTGYCGLGFFQHAGENLCADAIVTRFNPGSGDIEVLLGKDRQTGQYGLIGTFMDEKENALQTADRACRKKLGIELDFSKATVGKRIHMNDYRQTDDAYITSQGVHLHLSSASAAQQPLQMIERFDDIGWMIVTPEVFANLFASHGDLLKEALVHMVREETFESQRKLIEDKLQKIG